MRNIDIRLADRRTPWEAADWSEGQKRTSERLATASEMLDISGLAGWNVRAEEIFSASGHRVPNRYANVRSDGTVLGDVGDRYVILQPEEVFAFADAIVDDGRALWERAGQLRGGSVIFGCLELTEAEIRVPGDESPVKPYLLIVNSYDGSTPLEGVLAMVRPVCTNTFEVARGTQTPYRFRIRHTASLHGKIQMAREALNISFQHISEAGTVMAALAETKMTDAQVLDLFRKSVWPISASVLESEALTENHASTKAYENYLTSDTIRSIRGTAWGALNGVTEYTNHLQEYGKNSRKDSDEARSEAVLFGSAQARVGVALDSLLRLAHA